jgi:hypothetical protein
VNEITSDNLEEFVAAIEPSQPDVVKEIRIHMAKMCEATDREIVASALKFAEWMNGLQLPDTTTYPACCRGAATLR